MKETWVRSLGQQDPLENEIQPTSVFLPGKSHGQRSLAGYSLWGRKRVGYDLVTKQQWYFLVVPLISIVSGDAFSFIHDSGDLYLFFLAN